MIQSEKNTLLLSNLTHSQQLMWVGQEMNPDAPIYNMGIAFDIQGKISPLHFKNAFQKLIEQSDALRTVFQKINDTPQQQVRTDFIYELPFLDWSDKSVSSVKIKNWLSERCQHPFDLSKCLFDSLLIKISHQRFIWFFAQHHLITDAWATSIWYKKMAELYERSINGTLDDAPPLPLYADYLKFEKNAFTDPNRSPIKAYWEEKLAAMPEEVQLYGIKKESVNSRSERISILLGKERSAKLRELAQAADVRTWTAELSYYNIFLTTLFALLHRVSGQRKLIVGSPAHNRPTAVFKETPGVFVELFPLLIEIKEEDRFVDLLEKVRAEIFGFLKNAQPGVNSSESHRHFHVVLNFIHAKYADFNGLPMQSEWIHSGHFDPQNQLRIAVSDLDESGDFRLDFDFNTALFNETKWEETPQHFLNLLDAMIDDRGQVVEDVDILNKKEKEKLLTWGNGLSTIKPSLQNILTVFSKQVFEGEDRTAVRFEGEALTYQALDEQSNQLAHYLIKKGARQGNHIGLFVDCSLDLIIGIFGILKAGAAYLPMVSIYPNERLAFMMEDADIKFLLTHSCLINKIIGLDEKIILLDRERNNIKNEPIGFPKINISPNDLAYIIYTSGSTGQPKGNLIEHANVIYLIESLYENIYKKYKGHLNVALVAASVFDASVQQIFGALLQGHTLHIVPECVRPDGDALYQFFQENKIDISDGTPSHLRLLIEGASGIYLPKHFIIGGEALPVALIKKIRQKFHVENTVITNIYGVAECGVDSVAFDISNELELTGTTVPIGRPLKNERIYIVNKNDQLQPVGTPGEICIGGAGVGRGYLNRPDLTVEKFSKNPFWVGDRFYRTGDLAKYLPDGNILFLGRKDHQIKIRGYRIELGEIEQSLRTFKERRKDIQTVRNVPADVHRCQRCVLAERPPFVMFDQKGVCNVCRSYEAHEEQALQYFKAPTDFENLMADARQKKASEYDCMLLYSGGKDSSYVLYRLVEMGLKVLAFTFDNGFISKAAFDNIERQTSKLGVDCIIRKTANMNDIFVESLNAHSTVCSGCFKSLTAISTEIAYEKGINVIITGLSRGQVFDTKLEGLYNQGIFEVAEVEERLMLFRKLYHAADDRIQRLLNIDLGEVRFEDMHFVDFFRYDHTPIPEIREYLKQQDAYWRQPKDTGFCSSNCMMNDIGICVHSTTEGYHNYEAPLSWDVRLGISSREEVLPEVDSQVDTKRVNNVLENIGFFTQEIKEALVIDLTDEEGDVVLCAYFVANQQLKTANIKAHLKKTLPDYMVPVHFHQLEKFPLSASGKIDRQALPKIDTSRPDLGIGYIAPRTEIEEALAAIWSNILAIEEVGVYDNFLELGGHSLAAIRLVARMNEAFQLQLPVTCIFENPTIAALGSYVENTIVKLLEEMEG